MQSNHQHDRREATLLAVAMAIVGGLFLFDKLGILIRTSILSFQLMWQSSPVLLVALGACVLFLGGYITEPDAEKRRSKEGQHEL